MEKSVLYIRFKTNPRGKNLPFLMVSIVITFCSTKKKRGGSIDKLVGYTAHEGVV